MEQIYEFINEYRVFFYIGGFIIIYIVIMHIVGYFIDKPKKNKFPVNEIETEWLKNSPEGIKRIEHCNDRSLDNVQAKSDINVYSYLLGAPTAIYITYQIYKNDLDKIFNGIIMLLISASIIVAAMRGTGWALLRVFIKKKRFSELHKFIKSPQGQLKVMNFHRSEIEKRHQIDFWKNLNGRNFEKETAKVFKKNGFDVELTGKGSDKGIDIIMRKDNQLHLVQCKAHKYPVGIADIQRHYGVSAEKKAVSIFASTNGYTKQAKEFAKNVGMKLISTEDLIKLNKTEKEEITK